MSEILNLTVEFVSAPQASTAQTSDGSLLVFLAIFLLMLCALICFLLKKTNTLLLVGSVKGAHVKQKEVFSIKKKLLSFAATFSILTLLISGLFVFTQAFAGSYGGLAPDTNKIEAIVNDDGSISFSDCNLINTSDAFYKVTSSSVNVSEEAKSITALSSSNFVINGFGGILFDGAPDGNSYIPEGLTALPSNESTKLSFNLFNLDKESALSLCGKSVFQISLISDKVFKVSYNNGYIPGTTLTGNVPIDANLYHESEIATIMDQGTLQCIGYSFSGWKDSASGTIYQPEETTNIISCMQLIATWTPNIYTITLDWTGAKRPALPNPIYEKYNVMWSYEEMCIISQSHLNALPSKEGHSFLGYKFGDTEVIDKNGNFVVPPTFFTEDTTLYASWTLAVYKISLNPGEGASIIGTQSVYEKYSIGWFSNPECTDSILFIDKPTKSNYTFAGYKLYGIKDIIDATGRILVSSTEFTENKTLNASWDANVYTITLNSGPGTLSPGTQNIYEKYNTGWYRDKECSESIDSPIDIPTKANYTFAGYKNGATDIVDASGNVIAYPIAFVEDTALTAEWTGKVYKISLNPGDEVLEPGTKEIYEKYDDKWYADAECASPITSPIVIPTKANYTFAGYKNGTTDIVDSSGNVTDSAIIFNNDTTLNANWEGKVYKITLNPGEGVYHEGTQVIFEKYNAGWYHDDKCTKPISSNLDVPKKSKFSFAGYNIDDTDVVTASGAVIAPATTFNAYATLDASWTVGLYKITLDAGSEALTPGTQAIYLKYGIGWYSDDLCTTSIEQIVLPTIEHGSFAGYKHYITDIINNEGKIVAPPTEFDREYTLDALWDRDVFKITLDPNGGFMYYGTYYVKYNTGWFKSSTCEPESEVSSIIDLPFGKRGCSFTGFKFKNTDIIDEFGKIIGPLTIFTEDTILYADWAPNIYRVALNAGEGVADKGTETIYEKYGIGFYSDKECAEPITQISCPVKPGFSFGGYMYADYYIVNSEGKIVEPSYALYPYTSFADDATLDAIWNPNVYNDSFGDREDGLMPDIQTLQENYNSSFLSIFNKAQENTNLAQEKLALKTSKQGTTSSDGKTGETSPASVIISQTPKSSPSLRNSM